MPSLVPLDALHHERAAKYDPEITRHHEAVPVEDREGGACNRLRVEIGFDDGDVQQVWANAGIDHVALARDLARPAWGLAGLQHLGISDNAGLFIDCRHVDVRECRLRDFLPSIAGHFADGCPTPILRQVERRLFHVGKQLRLPDLTRLHQPHLLLRDPLQQFRRRLVARILRHELAAHGQIENEAAQAGYRVRRVSNLLVMRQQAFGVHRASASAKIAFNWSR